jgi:acyl-CoA synthetase (AMP-forming)/AMP-acid ligase II
MMHTHSLGRAARYYPERAALGSGGRHSTFRQLHDQVAGIAAALSRHGFERGDRLALLLETGGGLMRCANLIRSE